MTDEKGLTLVEVLAAIILLSVILLSIFGFFTNSFRFNAINDDNIQAMNVAREQQVIFHDTYNGMTIDEIKANFTVVPGKPNTYTHTELVNEYDITYTIYPAETGNFYRKLYEVHIEVINDGKLVSETYTYLEGNVVAP